MERRCAIENCPHDQSDLVGCVDRDGMGNVQAEYLLCQRHWAYYVERRDERGHVPGSERWNLSIREFIGWHQHATPRSA